MAGRGQGRPEVVIGDRFGASAAGEIVDRVEAVFAEAGFRVARNSPFAGAYMAQTYGRPSKGQHAIQIEIDRSLYMDEKAIRPHEGFNQLRSALRGVIGQVAALGAPGSEALAAE